MHQRQIIRLDVKTALHSVPVPPGIGSAIMVKEYPQLARGTEA